MNASFINGFDIATFTADENNEILSALISSTIEGYGIFNEINDWKRLNTMYEKTLAMEKIRNEFFTNNGAHINGDSQSLSPNIDLAEFSSSGREYSYTVGNNYYNEFVRFKDEMPHTQEVNHNANQHNVNNHIDLYSEHTNLYPDDKDALNDGDSVWKHTDNKDSLLSKTKALFRQNKINTIISRFHTDKRGDETDNDSPFGLSHGRNLLKRNEEYGGTSHSPNENGYDNPYCRVWTHHYQYDNLSKLIRPFVNDRDSETPKGVELGDMHTWTEGFLTEGGWKNHNKRWDYSVLNKNGHVNITPKFNEGGNKSLHTKQCMFSIENLAWKGMSPYEFERNLSWEQRGPMGGRIMWFPPYGITFNETTSAQWNASSFIGRGEDVYTYVNTKRSGSLSFIMVVDHPSVIDYTTWHSESTGVTDTDYLRFFAGCDSGKASDNGSTSTDGEQSAFSLFSATRPPKYTEHEGGKPIVEEVTQDVADPEPLPVNEDIVEEEAPIANTIDIVFYVFFPNNYSGVYDLPSPMASEGCQVHCVPYLINGIGTNKRYLDGNSNFPYKYKEKNTLTSSEKTDIINKTVDTPIDESTFIKLTRSYGYEIYDGEVGIGCRKGGLINDEYVPIMGTTTVWSLFDCAKNKPYPMTDGSKKNGMGEIPVYFYRPDGEYKTPSSKNDPAVKLNTYDDQLRVGNYEDQMSYGYNSSIGYDSVAKHFNENTDIEEEECLYAFTEVVAASVYTKYGKSFEDKGIVDSSRLSKLVDIFNNYKVVEVSGFGTASSQSNSSVSDANQSNLSENRYKSIVNWLKTTTAFSGDVDFQPYQKDDDIKAVVGQDVSSSSAKLGRYVRIAVKFKSDDKQKLSETKQTVQTIEPVTEEASKLVSVATVDDEGNKTYELKQVSETQETVQKSIDYSFTKEDEAVINTVMAEGYTREEAISLVFGTAYNINNLESNGSFRMPELEASYVVAEAKPKVTKVVTENNNGDANKLNYLRYDQEYRFFKELELTQPIVFKNLMDKLQYFDPAFHSMTPEGFNGRLSFLHQCTRQGATISSSDQNGQATNLAFGRPPVCVLRLGDFYNQMIVINSISMTYDGDGGLQWDLNPEGSGVQPLLAHITLSFDFIGGGDMTGPIRRLQNAMTFNYYANQGLYDNRADWVERKWNHIKADSNDSHYDGILNHYTYPGPILDDREGKNLSGDESTNNREND